MTWNHSVIFTPDPVNGGVNSPGIAGRLYLFGPEIGIPELHEGTLTVDLFDETEIPNGGESVLIERWRIDKDTLKRLQKRDTIGWGYTVYLPWSTYRPGSLSARLKVCFEPMGQKMPIYQDSGPIMIEGPLLRSQFGQTAAKLQAPKAANTTPVAHVQTPALSPRGTLDR